MRPLHSMAAIMLSCLGLSVFSTRAAEKGAEALANTIEQSQASEQPRSTGTCRDLALRVEELADGFQFTEGPAWDNSRGRWLFSDVIGDAEYAITPDGAVTLIRDQAGFPNGRAQRSNGQFVVAQHDRTLNLVEGDGTNFRRLIDTYQGKKLNSPNDVSIDEEGNIYFTDSMYGIQGYGPEEAESELGYAGIYKYTDGQLILLNKDLATPNGIAISNDQSTLIVSDTSTDQLFSLNLKDFTGQPITATLLTKLTKLNGGGQGHGPDGLKISADGLIWATGQGCIHVLQADGTFHCGIPFPEHVTNLAFGGAGNNEALVTSGDKVYKITLK